MLNGVDLSHYQHATPSLAGISFLWAKATEGTGYADPMYAVHTAAAIKAGIVHGAYHFGHAGVDPAAQARFLVAHAPNAQLYALDSEGSTRMTHAEVRAFFAALKAARLGVKVGLYESLSGYDQGLGQDFNWVAAWGSTPPSIPWTFWQVHELGHDRGLHGPAGPRPLQGRPGGAPRARRGRCARASPDARVRPRPAGRQPVGDRDPQPRYPRPPAGPPREREVPPPPKPRVSGRASPGEVRT